MSIPYWALLILYGIFVLIFLTISGFGIYHSWRFGFRAPFVHIVTTAYLAGVAIVIILSISIILNLDWSAVWEITAPF